MRIQHNIAALNSHRQLTNNNSAVAKNLEKLSSGYKINRAGDDAAGLAISEKMRAQITGLDTASRNAQDGISLVQTAEGALTEVHSMLNRMAELADQSANGTYQDSVDRENIQKELNSLRSEVDRISAGTNFNGIKLLDGSLSAKGAPGSSTSATVSFVGPKGVNTDDVTGIAGIYEMSTAITTTFNGVSDKVSYTFNYTDKQGTAQSKKIDLTLSKSEADSAKYVLKDADGNEYELADPDTEAAEVADIHSAIMDALKSDETFSTNFKVTDNAVASGSNFTFTALDKGVNGAKLTGVDTVITEGADGTFATEANGVTVATPAKDAYKSVDLSKAAIFDGKNGDKSIFEINGEKFAFIDQALTGDDLTKTIDLLREAGVRHFVQTAATTIIDGDDIAAMVTKINDATGLDIKQGTNADGVFTEGVAATDLSISLTARPNPRPGKAQAGGGLTLQIGESSESFNQLNVSISSMSIASLGLDKIDIGDQNGAKAAIDKIKTAINSVSSTRGDLGAIQNRLEHTINNLGVTSENMSAAESRIRDVDMAKEMMTFTKNNILTQASQAMLAQANQLPQGVLQLLQ